MKRLKALIVGLVLLSTMKLVTAEAYRAGIQVETFENPSNFRESTIGNALTDLFVTELTQSGRFRVFESSNPENGVRPEFLFFAKVTNFSFQENRVKVAQAGHRNRLEAAALFEQEIDVRIDFRVVDSNTNEVVFADKGESKTKNKSAHAFAADFNRMVAAGVSVSTHEVLGSMMGRTSVEALQRTIRRLNDYFDIVGFESTQLEGVVLGNVDSKTVVVGLGAKAGLRTGDRLTAYREAEIRNSDGVVIYSKKELVGELEVFECQEERALARVVGDVEVSESDHVIRMASGPTFEDRIRRGNQLIEKQFYAPALREFQAAMRLQPDSLDAAKGIAGANMFLKNFSEAFSGLERVLDRNGELEIPVYHHHSFNPNCFGRLHLSHRGVRFDPPSGADEKHAFNVGFNEISDLKNGSRSIGFKAPDNDEGKVRTWNFQILLPDFSEFGRSVNYIQYTDDMEEVHTQLLTFMARVIAAR